MAKSSSANKVAKLASRGKGKKVRFQSGTTFPTIVAVTIVAMIVLVAYAKVTMPGVESGPPQAGDQWTMAYEFRVCNEAITLQGDPAELDVADASAGDRNQLANGQANSAGFINYHPQEGGATGRRAKLGVFLDEYDVKLSDTKLEFPESQGIEPRVYDIDSNDVFAGTDCEGEDAEIRVRVWDDASTDGFIDNITDFRNLRFTDNGMAFSIAVVPKKADIPKPATASRLEEFGVIGEGSAPTDTTPTETTVDTSAPTTTG